MRRRDVCLSDGSDVEGRDEWVSAAGTCLQLPQLVTCTLLKAQRHNRTGIPKGSASLHRVPPLQQPRYLPSPLPALPSPRKTPAILRLAIAPAQPPPSPTLPLRPHR